MRSRSGLLVLVAALALVACPLGFMRWSGDRALAQLIPAGEVRWDGYVVHHEWRWETDLASDGDLHHVRVQHGDLQVLDEHYYVREHDFREGPVGFFGGLQIDEDPDIELVFCQDGVVESIIQPDRTANILVEGRSANLRAREVCEAVHRAGSRPDFTCVMCCLIPTALPAFIVIMIFARRERREEEREGRSTF